MLPSLDDRVKTLAAIIAPGRWAAGPLLLLASQAYAAHEDTLSEADYFSEQPIVLSASKLAQPANRAPAAVTVITREMIEASGFRHLVDVLRLVPGFLVGWSGGNMPAATYIGLSDAFPHWMQIMVDGRSVYNPAYGHTTWRGIPLTLDEVDRIEVVRGPNSANDGLNSMLGTVHIYTRHSSMTLGGMGEAAAGDKDYHEANLRYGTKTSNGSWRLSLRALEDERHGVSYDQATDLQMNFRGDFQPTLQDDLMVEFGASRNFWEGTNVGQYMVDGQHTYYLSGFANLKWRHALGSGREWSLQLDHTFNQNEEDIVSTMNGDYRTTGSSIVFNYLDQPVANLRTSLSGEYRLNRVKLPGLLGSDGYVEDDIFRVSGAAEWSVSPQWLLHAGAMLEHHSDTDEAYLSPRLALNWLPSSEHAFRASIAQGLSALGLYVNNTDIKVITNKGKLDQKYLSSGTVDPEKINSVELGYLLSKPAWGLNLDVRAFYNRLEDIVGLKNTPAPHDTKDGKAKTYWNETDGTLHGFEYQLRWQPGRHSWLVLSQAWISSDSDSDNHDRSIPPYTLSLLATHRIADFDLSLGYYRLGNMRWIGAEYDSKYNRLDLRLAKAWKTAGGKVQAALVFQSLLGEEFEGMTEDPYERQEFERRGYLSLKYEFK